MGIIIICFVWIIKKLTLREPTFMIISWITSWWVLKWPRILSPKVSSWCWSKKLGINDNFIWCTSNTLLMSNSNHPVFYCWYWTTWTNWEIIQMIWSKLPCRIADINKMNFDDFWWIQRSSMNVIFLSGSSKSIKIIYCFAWQT